MVSLVSRVVFHLSIKKILSKDIIIPNRGEEEFCFLIFSLLSLLINVELRSCSLVLLLSWFSLSIFLLDYFHVSRLDLISSFGKLQFAFPALHNDRKSCVLRGRRRVSLRINRSVHRIWDERDKCVCLCLCVLSCTHIKQDIQCLRCGGWRRDEHWHKPWNVHSDGIRFSLMIWLSSPTVSFSWQCRFLSTGCLCLQTSTESKPKDNRDDRQLSRDLRIGLIRET